MPIVTEHFWFRLNQRAGSCVVDGVKLVMEGLSGSMVPEHDEASPFETTEASPNDFCRRIHPKLAGALRLYLGERDTADELAQDALVRVIERWPQVRTMDNPEGWAYRVAFNLARSRLRRRLAERRAHERSGRTTTTSWNVDVASVLSVRAAVAALPPRQRQAVVLRYYADLPLGTIAEAMGCATGTVKAHLHEALKRLRTAELTPPETPTAPDATAAPVAGT